MSPVPARVDFAGGWLDVPKLSRRDGYIVNCSITPSTTLEHKPFDCGSGMGMSAIGSILSGKDPFLTEVGWQDPAVILETGLCVWRSGPRPVLDFKVNPDFLMGFMAVWDSRERHTTNDLVDKKRDYDSIVMNSRMASAAAAIRSLSQLMLAVRYSYEDQLKEGMPPAPDFCEYDCAFKWLGSGWGGHVLYLFSTRTERDLFAENTAYACKVEPCLVQHWY